MKTLTAVMHHYINPADIEDRATFFGSDDSAARFDFEDLAARAEPDDFDNLEDLE